MKRIPRPCSNRQLFHAFGLIGDSYGDRSCDLKNRVRIRIAAIAFAGDIPASGISKIGNRRRIHDSTGANCCETTNIGSAESGQIVGPTRGYYVPNRSIDTTATSLISVLVPAHPAKVSE